MLPTVRDDLLLWGVRGPAVSQKSKPPTNYIVDSLYSQCGPQCGMIHCYGGVRGPAASQKSTAHRAGVWGPRTGNGQDHNHVCGRLEGGLPAQARLFAARVPCRVPCAVSLLQYDPALLTLQGNTLLPF